MRVQCQIIDTFNVSAVRKAEISIGSFRRLPVRIGLPTEGKQRLPLFAIVIPRGVVRINITLQPGTL